jgi:ADP-heptose:LPS heptosyltransferase
MARFPLRPQRILALKGHSAGVGDILRSSAAWRALKLRFGEDVAVHAVLLSRDAGYVSASLMAQHPLLAGYSTVSKTGKGWAAWTHMAKALEEIARTFKPDLIIDFESAGMRSSTLAAWLGLRLNVATLGIAEFPGRSWFYSRSAPSSSAYARQRGLHKPMDYTNRDFVALAALGIERNNLPIELEPTAAAQRFGEGLRQQFGLAPETLLLGLNIGCGTPDAIGKRPSLEALSRLVSQVQAAVLAEGRPVALMLTGAAFERDVNEAFAHLHRANGRGDCLDLAGQTDLVQLAGVIRQCRLFLSTDSGPYHMAVGLKVPTLALFNRGGAEQHHHRHPWVRCQLLMSDDDVEDCVNAARALLTEAA